MSTFTQNIVPVVSNCRIIRDHSNNEYYFVLEFSNSSVVLTELSLGFATKGSCRSYLEHKDFYKNKELGSFGGNWTSLDPNFLKNLEAGDSLDDSLEIF